MKVRISESFVHLTLVLVTSFLALEVMATIWLAVTSGGVFQLKNKTSSIPAESHPSPPPNAMRSIAVLNPYFGYSVRPGVTVERLAGPRASSLFDAPNGPVWARVKDLKASPLGMWDEHPIPYIPAADEKVVGIFGASNVRWLALQAGDRLIAELTKAAPGKRIVLLNFGMPAGKQPQQLLMLSYLVSLGQHFDLVINIDGYAEIVFGGNNVDAGVDFTMPSTHMTAPIWRGTNNQLPSAQSVGPLATHIEAKDWSETIARWRRYNRSAAIEVILEASQTYYEKKAQDILTEFVRAPVDAANDVYVMPKNREASAADALPRIAEHWRRSSSAMAVISNGIGAGYLHVLGPSPTAGSRHFEREELAIVQPDNPMSRRAAAGFPYLLAHPPELPGERAAYVAATDLFDRVPEPVYADPVHQNLRGGEILADFLAKQVISRKLLQ